MTGNNPLKNWGSSQSASETPKVVAPVAKTQAPAVASPAAAVAISASTVAVAPAAPDMTPLYDLICRVRRLLRSSWIATGLGITLGLLFGILVSAAVVDLVVPLWPAFRFVALVLVVVPALSSFVAGVVRPLLRRLGARRVARTIEQHIPKMHNRLVSCVDLKDAHSPEKVSPAFYRRLVNEALDRIRGFQPSSIIDFVSLRRAGIAAFSGVAAFLIAFGTFSDRLPTALARIFHPFEDIPPATGVLYTVIPGNAKVLRGEDVLLAAEVTKGSPDRLQVEIRSPRLPQPLWHDLKKEGDRWTFSLSGFEHSFTYRVHGGGTWSKLHEITMLDRPRIVELHTLLHYPEYMGITEPRMGPPQTADTSGPVGSKVEVVVATAGNVARGEIQRFKMQSVQSEVAERAERIWFFEQIPDGAQPQGTWEWDFRLLGRNAHTDPFAAAAHGHQFQNAPKPFRAEAGEHFFAYVYVMPDQRPDTIMLEWQDAAGFEHRAFWGDDKLPGGTLGSASKRYIGPMPPAGEWVRLEVPAALVDLENKDVRGMAFNMFGGKCVWHRVGTLPPAHKAEEMLVADGTFPMHEAGPDTWSGQVPLDSDGYYRVELRNELDYANKPMKEARLTAIPDNPPQIILERPTTDLTFSVPQKVPLVISAFDDFGLAKLVLSVQRGTGGFEAIPIKRYKKPVRNDNAVYTLDLPQMGLKMGDQIRYRVEAHDRAEQSKSTVELTIKIQDDPNAADKKLATFEKSADTFQEKLVKLIADQAKVQEAVEKLTAKYEPLSKKIEEAKQIAQAKTKLEQANQPPADPTKSPPPPVPPKPLELDPETVKQLEALRQELAPVAQQEEQNTALSKQVAQELAAAVEQTKTLQTLPPDLVNQFLELPQRFDQSAVQPLQNLTNDIKAGATPQQPPPDLPKINEAAEKVQRELAQMQERIKALANVEKKVNQDVEAALQDLAKEMLRDQAGMTEKQLAELQEFLNKLREELKAFEGTEEQLLDASRKVPEVMLADVEKRQNELEEKANPELAQAREVLKAEDIRRLKRKLKDFPKAPYSPEGDDYLVPPGEEDTPEEDMPAKADEAADKDKADAKDKKDADDADNDEEDLFMPALGGPRPKLDPRFADKIRPVERKNDKSGEKTPGERQRQELGSRQQEKLKELKSAEMSLEADEETLAGLLDRLREAAQLPEMNFPQRPDGQRPQPPRPNAPRPDVPDPLAAQPQNAQPQLDAEELAGRLAELMQSPEMREARAMMNRVQQMRAQMAARAQNQAQNPNQPQGPKQPAPANQAATFATLPGIPLEEALEGIDLDTRTLILKMQPRVREELLQGLKDEGPDGYQKFIRNYFQRLARVSGEKK
jgi:hypothetical protein